MLTERAVLSIATPGPIRVLIVDAHKMFADSLTIRLDTELDLEVIGCAFDLPTGVRDAERTRPDVAIVEAPLHDRDGAGAAGAILGASPTTQILMLARIQDDAGLGAAVDAGCSGFITQDESTAELVAAVRQLAAGESYMSSQFMSKLMPRLGTNYRGLGADLTTREREVLELLAEGTATSSIASQLFVSVNTVRQHVQRVLFKLSAHSKLEAVAIAVREGIVKRSF
jgi:DNA-binding NarL/FixJ family response regulator